MRKTLFILIAVFCLVGIIFFFITWKSCPTEKNKDGFDFVENFFKAEMNYTMTAEELDTILSTCSATTVCSQLNSKLNTLLSTQSVKELTGTEFFNSLPALPNSVIRMIFQPEDDFITDFELHFREGQNSYLLSSEANKLILARTKNGKTDELTRWEIDRTKDKYGRIILNIAYFKKLLLIYNSTSNLTIGYYNGLEEYGKNSSIHIKNKNSTRPGKVFLKVAEIKQRDFKLLTDSLILMRLLNDRNVSYWNRLYPEHMVPVRGEKSVFLQRIDKDYSNSRTILLPADSTISWDVHVPDKGYLDFGLSLMMKNTYDPSVLRLLLNVKDIESGEELELTYDINEDQFWSYKWSNRRLKLDKFQGRECRITFKGLSNPEATKKEKKSVLLLANPVMRGPRKINEKNIILISLDTLRADHLGCYDYKRDTSPNIDKVTVDGILFYQAISSAPWTLPSHLSILSSLYPLETGYRQIREGDEEDMWRNHYIISRLADEVETLAEVLKKNNYQTNAMTLGGLVGPIFGFDQGFEQYSWKGKVYQDVEKEIRDLIKWIRRNKNNKFFMFFHTYEIHDPYTRRYFTDYDKKNDIERIIANYDSGIHYTDKHLNTLFKYLKKEKLWENTIIIITSDHGENFSPELIKNDAGGHGGTLYDCELRVPIIILGGGFDKGLRINDQVQTVDIMPTILDMIGIKPEGDIRGISLLPLIRGEKIRPRIAYSEAVILRPESWDKHSVRTNERKLIRNFRDHSSLDKSSLEYYNLTDDPGEKKNIASGKDNLMDSLLMYLKKISDSIIKQGKKLPMNKFSDDNSLNDEIRNELKALGYLG